MINLISSSYKIVNIQLDLIQPPFLVQVKLCLFVMFTLFNVEGSFTREDQYVSGISLK